VVWLNTQSSPFCVGRPNGTKQGGISSPFLFTRYIRPLLAVISSSNVGCQIGGIAVNIFAYADDIVLLAPSWHALQDLLLLLDKCCKELGMLCNTNKTKCMILNPTDKTKTVFQTFSHFTIDGHCLQFVNEFRYLGHIKSNNLCDDADIKRQIHNMYVRTNMLIQRFRNCSQYVKMAIFRAYCTCLYGVALWSVGYSK